jgi:glycine hydroxymethyltransferase
MEKRLDACGITVNKNAIPNDPEKPFVTSGIRVGSPAVTTRGLTEEDMRTVAHLMRLCATDFDTERENIRAKVDELCAKYPLFH